MKKPLNKEEAPQIEITTIIGCPTKCKICPQETFIKRYKEISDVNILTFENFKKVVDNLPLNINITFAGMSEPWLNPDCTKMLLYAYDTGHTHISVFTTGLGMTVEDVKKIRHIPFDNFVLHIPDTYGVTKIPPNDKYYSTLLELAFSSITQFKVVAYGEKYYKDLKTIFPKITPLNLISRCGEVEKLEKTYNKGPITCGTYNKPGHFMLFPDGTVSLCCMDWTLKHILGNLLKDEFKDLYNSEEYKKVLNGFKDETIDISCRKCEWATIQLSQPYKKLKRKEK